MHSGISEGKGGGGVKTWKHFLVGCGYFLESPIHKIINSPYMFPIFVVISLRRILAPNNDHLPYLFYLVPNLE